MKLSCAFVLTLTNLVIASPFSFSVKGSGTSEKAGSTAVPATFGLVHNVALKANGYSGRPPTPASIGFTTSSESSSFDAFNYNSGHAYGSSEYIAPGEVGYNVATVPQAVAVAAANTNAENLANIKASGSYSSKKINNFSTNSASHFQYQPTTFESKPTSPFSVTQSTSIDSYEHPKHVLITSKQSEKSEKFNQPSEVQSLPCQTFNSGSVIAEESPVYNRGFGGPSGILTPDNKAPYFGSSSFSIKQSTTESVKPVIQSLNNEYNKPLDTDVSAKPGLKPTASIKPFNDEETNKDHFVTSSQHGQVSYIKDKNTLSSLGAEVPSTSEYSIEKLPANILNGSKPIQNFQIFVQPYYSNVLPSSDNNIQNEKTFTSLNNPEKKKQTQEITYTGGFGAPTGILKPFNQLQSSGHTFVSLEKPDQYETSKTNKVTTTKTKESTVTTSSKKSLNEIKVNDTPSTERITYKLYENETPTVSYATQKSTSPVYDEYSVTSDNPVLSTSKTDSDFLQLEHKEINETSKQSENNSFNPIVTSWVQDPTSSSSFSKVPVSYAIEKQIYVNSLDAKPAVSNSFDKLKPSYPFENDDTQMTVLSKTPVEQPKEEIFSKKFSVPSPHFISSNRPFKPVITSVSFITSQPNNEILIPNQNKSVYTPIAATKLTPVSSWEQSTYKIPIKSNFENTQPSKLFEKPKSPQSKYPLGSDYTVAKVKQEISGESYRSEHNRSTPVSVTVVPTLLSEKPKSTDFLLFTTPKPPTASVNGANQHVVTSSTGFSSTSSEYSESHKISSTSDHTLAGINAQSQKAQKTPNKAINNFAYPTANVASLVNFGPIQSEHQSIPNLSILSTNTGTASVESTLVTIAQQSSYESSHEYVTPTVSSVSKISENPKVWSSGNALFIDYSSSTQKSNNVPNPTASVASQGSSSPIQIQNQFNPNLSISSTSDGTLPPESTLVTFTQQSSYKPSHEFAAPTASSIPKVSESPKVWSTENPSSIDYSSSTQKPNNFANPTATFASQTNSNSVQSQHKLNPNLSPSTTNIGSAYVQSTLGTFAQQSSYEPSHEHVAPTASSVSKIFENPKVWSSGNVLSIDYGSSTQKSNNVPNPTASVASQGSSSPIQIQNQFNSNLSISSTNDGTLPPESTLVTFTQQSSYKPSHEFAAPTASSIPKVSESPKVWSTENPSSIDYSSSTQKPNNFANPTATFASQTNSNSVQSQHKLNPNLSPSTTNVGSAYVQSTLGTFAQQSSYEPSHEHVAPTASSVSKIFENPKVWSSGNVLSIDYSSSTQKSNNVLNVTASLASQDNSNPIQSQIQINPNLSISSTNVGTSPTESTLVAFAQQSSYKPSHEFGAPTASSITKVSESSKVWSTQNPSSIDYSSSTQKLNNFANPIATFASQTNSNSVQSHHKLNPNLSISSTNVGSAYVEPTLATFAQQSTYEPSIVNSSIDSSVPKVSENTEVFLENPTFIDNSSSVQKANNLTYSGTSSNSYIKESQLQSSTAPTDGNVTPIKPLYSNTFGTLTGAVTSSGYSHSTVNSFTSSISNSKYDVDLVSVSNVKPGQSNYFSQYKPALSGYSEKTTTLSSLYPTNSIYVSTAKPYVTLASSNIAQQSTELNQESLKFSSSLDSTTKPNQGPKQQLNNNGISTVSILTPSSIKPTSPTVSYSSVFPTSGPVFVTGLSQSKPQNQYSTVQPATQKKQWYTNTFESFGGVKPQNRYTYPGFTSSFSNFGYGSSIVANKQFNRVPLTDQYKPYSIGQHNPTSTGQYISSSTGYYNPITSGQYKPLSTGQYNPILTGQNKPTSTGRYNPTSTRQYNPILTNQYKPYNWGFSRQPVTLKPSGQIIPAGDPITTADAPKSSTSLEKSKLNQGFSILNQNETSFTSGFASHSVSHTTLKPISSIEEYSGNHKTKPFISTTPKTNTQKPWFIASQATTHAATNLLENSDSVTNQFFNAQKPTAAPISVVPSYNPPSASTVPKHSSAVSTENNNGIISDKEEIKDQVTNLSEFQHNPSVFSNSFNSVITSKPSAKPGQNISSKPQDQSIVSQKDSLLIEDQTKLDINVKPTNLHSSSTIHLPESIYSSSNQLKPTATVSLSAQSENSKTVYQKPLSQHSSLFHSGTTQLSKPNIKISVINPPSSSTVHSQYIGSFGGPSGLLKPHDFSGPFVQANVPSQKNVSHQNQPALDINSGLKVAEHSKLGSYSGGFGGPPGVLKPDNSEIHTGIFYAGQDEQSQNVETNGFHGSLTNHNLSPTIPFVGSYADIKTQNVYPPFLPTKPNKAASENSEGLANSKVESYNQQHSGIFHDSGNTKSTSTFSGQFGKVNSLTTIAPTGASTGTGTGLFGLKRAFTSGVASADSSGPIANTGNGSKIFKE